MLGVVLPARHVIYAIAVLYALCVLVALAVFTPDIGAWTPVDFLRMAAIAIGPYSILVLTIALYGWRLLWRLIPALNRIYPDLNGEWDLEISWSRDELKGNVNARASIKQTLFRISMEVDAPASDSKTLSATPKKDPESGRPALHYIYLVTPHATAQGTPAPYRGAAILDVADGGRDQMGGNYWTTHQSIGRFVLRRRAAQRLTN